MFQAKHNLVVPSFSDSSTIDSQTLESYLFAENKSDFLKRLIPDSESHTFLSLLHTVNTSNELPSMAESEVARYAQKFNNHYSQNIRIRSLLKMFDSPSTPPTVKSDIINELKATLSLSFSHSKPSNITTSTLADSKEVLPSSIDPKLLLWESDFEQAYWQSSKLQDLNPNVLSRLDTGRIAAGDLNIFHTYMYNVNPVDVENFAELLNKFLKLRVTEVQPFLTKLTIEQIKAFIALDPSYANDSSVLQALCVKEFKSEIHELGQGLQPQEKRDLMFRLYTWLQDYKAPLITLYKSTLYELLQLDLELNQYNQDLLVEYLKHPLSFYNNMQAQHLESLTKRSFYTTSNLFGTERIPVDDLILAYLRHFFIEAKDTKPFDLYLTREHLQSIFYTVKLTSGQAPESTEVLTPQNLKALIESKEVSLRRYNKTHYKANDPVVLTLAIKNVPSLIVKIFEFRPESYYLKEKREIDSNVNLDGLITSEEKTFTFTEPPTIKMIKDFPFESISKAKQGIFIIDFIGNGVSSRALIRKGKLSLIERQTVAGQVFTIIDEEANVCKTGRAGIWLKDRFYKADEEGQVLVPYNTVQTEKAVLVHNNFAELMDLNLKAEVFEFKGACIYNAESFLMGNKAKILVQPRLFLNQEPLGLDILQSCSATITTVNMDGISSQTSFKDLKPSAYKEIELEFPIPAKLKSISLQLEAKIVPVNKQETKSYSYNQSLYAEPESLSFVNLYLRNSQEGYQIFLLGKNGEPKVSDELFVYITNKYTNQQKLHKLQTDKEGKVSLGKPQDYNQIMTVYKQKSKVWNINNTKSVNYPKSLRISEDDQVVLPTTSNELNRHKYSLVEVLRNGSVRSNKLDSLKIDNNRLIISGLKEGHYQLNLKEADHTISIAVVKGQHWSENSEYLHVGDALISTKSNLNNIVITDINVKPTENSELADITITAFVDQPKIARFHAVGTQFVEVNPNRMTTEMDSNLPAQTSLKIPLKGRHSQFMNNRKLGDEFCYVLERKSHARFMGNTAEKPQLFLKKTFVRDTQTQDEELSQTQDFTESLVARDETRSYDMHDGVSQIAMCPASGFRGASGNYQIDNSLNFLANPALVVSNLKVDDHGTIIIKNFPYKKYSMLQIVASNLTSNITQIFPLHSQHVQTKDLTQKPRDGESAFSTERVTVPLSRGAKIQIKDLTSSEIQVIDSLSGVSDIQKNLSSSNAAKYSTWDFLKDWETLSYDQKLKKYDKYASHELNIFVYFRDNEFFTKVIQPFLKNKIEKTFIDYFLLNDEDKVKEAARAEHFNKLNSLEKILVINSLQKVDPEQAKTLVSVLESKEVIKDADTFNRYFDTALAAKNPNQDQISSIQKEKAKAAVSQNQNMMQMDLLEMPIQQYQAYPQANVSFQNNSMSFGMSQSHQSNFMVHQSQMAPPAHYSAMTSNMPQAYGVMMSQAAPAGFGSQRGPSRAFNRRSSPSDPYQADKFHDKRADIRAGFQGIDKTKEYQERHYYSHVGTHLAIPLNQFWIDLARHIIQHGLTKPFLSENFLYAHSSQTEMIAVLAFLSLPSKSETHKYTSHEGLGVEIEAGSDLLLLTKAVNPADKQIRDEVVIIQRIYDDQDLYAESEEEPGVQIQKEVDEFVVDKVYRSIVVVTNLSTSNHQVQVLVEIPEGAIPLQNHLYTKSHNAHLNSYTTQTFQTYFYFPLTGKFRLNAPNVSKRGKVIAIGNKGEIHVKTEKTNKSLGTLVGILTQGSKDDILNFAKSKNIHNPKIFDFDSIYWLLTNKDFFLPFIQILREKKYYDHTVWSYGFYHQDVQTIREYFSNTPDNNVTRSLKYVKSSLLQTDKLRLLEYGPFINQRVHLMPSEKNRILNIQLKQQYQQFVGYLCERTNLEAPHYLGLVYYLLLLDRIEEAIRFFGKVDRSVVRQTQTYELQYDYFAAYIDFLIGYPNFSVAREVCKKYLDYPVLSWRNAFKDISNQLAEVDKDEKDNEKAISNEQAQNKANATTEEIINMEIHQSQLHITHQNVSHISVAFYRVDLEVLFSKNPFITTGTEEFSYIQPNQTLEVEISNPKQLDKKTIDVPKNLQNYSLCIELRTANKTLSGSYFPNALQVQTIESYGQIKVLDQKNHPLTKVYVKCFAKAADGKVSYYKDGYTDLRGRFDYATLNSNDLSNIKQFAIFVMSDELGSLVKEVKPPGGLGKVEN